MIKAKDLYVRCTDGIVECSDGRCPCNGDMLVGSAPWTIADLRRAIREHLADPIDIDSIYDEADDAVMRTRIDTTRRRTPRPDQSMADLIRMLPGGITLVLNTDPILERKTDDPIHPRPVE